MYADLTGDGTEEMITLKDRRLEADRIDGSLLYESRSEWQISDFLIHDIDQDGRNELLMLAWRIGSYGTSRPFWEDEEAGEDHYSQHIFIFRYEEDRVRAVWMSSETGIDIRDWEIGDEGRLVLVDAAGEKSRWFWDSWGLTKADP